MKHVYYIILIASFSFKLKNKKKTSRNFTPVPLTHTGENTMGDKALQSDLYLIKGSEIRLWANISISFSATVSKCKVHWWKTLS